MTKPGPIAERLTVLLAAFSPWDSIALTYRQFAAEIGQWSSVEVRRTVTWALKDLARRLRVLGFDMGMTFELTDEWAGTIGLPVRQPPPSSDDESPTP